MDIDNQYDIILLKRGPKSRLPHLDDGEVAFLTDKKKFAVGTPTGNEIIDEFILIVGEKIYPTFVEPQTANSFLYRDVGPVRHFVLSEFKLYKKDKNILESTANADMGTYPIPMGTTFVSIGGKLFLVQIAVQGNKITAYSPKDISEAALKTGGAVQISGYFQVLV